MNVYASAISYTGTKDGETRSRFGIKALSPKAILVEMSNDMTIWLPLSQIEFLSSEVGLFVEMPAWLARQNGLEYTKYIKDYNRVDVVISGKINEDAALKIK